MVKLWVDPPSGWRYGFPKVWDSDISPDRLFWMVEMGYPQAEIDRYGDYFIVRSWPYNQEPDNIEIRKKINLEDEQSIV